jgi:hypothetical protein
VIGEKWNAEFRDYGSRDYGPRREAPEVSFQLVEPTARRERAEIREQRSEDRKTDAEKLILLRKASARQER